MVKQLKVKRLNSYIVKILKSLITHVIPHFDQLTAIRFCIESFNFQKINELLIVFTGTAWLRLITSLLNSYKAHRCRIAKPWVKSSSRQRGHPTTHSQSRSKSNLMNSKSLNFLYSIDDMNIQHENMKKIFSKI